MNVKQNRNNWLVRISVLLISIDAASAAVVSGVIPLMKETFKNVASSTVESASTVPSLSILLFILIKSICCKKNWHQKDFFIGLRNSIYFWYLAILLEQYLCNLIMPVYLRCGSWSNKSFSIHGHFSRIRRNRTGRNGGLW